MAAASAKGAGGRESADTGASRDDFDNSALLWHLLNMSVFSFPERASYTQHDDHLSKFFKGYKSFARLLSDYKHGIKNHLELSFAADAPRSYRAIAQSSFKLLDTRYEAGTAGANFAQTDIAVFITATDMMLSTVEFFQMKLNAFFAQIHNYIDTEVLNDEEQPYRRQAQFEFILIQLILALGQALENVFVRSVDLSQEDIVPGIQALFNTGVYVLRVAQILETLDEYLNTLETRNVNTGCLSSRTEIFTRFKVRAQAIGEGRHEDVFVDAMISSELLSILRLGIDHTLEALQPLSTAAQQAWLAKLEAFADAMPDRIDRVLEAEEKAAKAAQEEALESGVVASILTGADRKHSIMLLSIELALQKLTYIFINPETGKEGEHSTVQMHKFLEQLSTNRVALDTHVTTRPVYAHEVDTEVAAYLRALFNRLDINDNLLIVQLWKGAVLQFLCRNDRSYPAFLQILQGMFATCKQQIDKLKIESVLSDSAKAAANTQAAIEWSLIRVYRAIYEICYDQHRKPSSPENLVQGQAMWLRTGVVYGYLTQFFNGIINRGRCGSGVERYYAAISGGCCGSAIELDRNLIDFLRRYNHINAVMGGSAKRYTPMCMESVLTTVGAQTSVTTAADAMPEALPARPTAAMTATVGAPQGDGAKAPLLPGDVDGGGDWDLQEIDDKDVFGGGRYVPPERAGQGFGGSGSTPTSANDAATNPRELYRALSGVSGISAAGQLEQAQDAAAAANAADDGVNSEDWLEGALAIGDQAAAVSFDQASRVGGGSAIFVGDLGNDYFSASDDEGKSDGEASDGAGVKLPAVLMHSNGEGYVSGSTTPTADAAAAVGGARSLSGSYDDDFFQGLDDGF